MSREKAQAALEALREATKAVLASGDRYMALQQRSIANAFFNLLPILAQAKSPLAEMTADEAWPKVAPAAPESLPDFLDRIAGELEARDTLPGAYCVGVAQSLRGRAIILRHDARPKPVLEVVSDVAQNRIEVPVDQWDFGIPLRD